MVLPPFGFISWVNPIITAGYYFPAFGELGFIVLLSFIGVLLFIHKYFSSIIPIVLIGSITLGSPLQITSHTFDAVHSHFYYGPAEADPQKENQRLKHYLKIANQSDKNFIVLPENALGYANENDKLA